MRYLSGVVSWRKRLEAIRANPKDVRFDELCRILERLGFEEVRRRGSHRIFRKAGVADLVNLQSTADGKAKRYQVDQVLELIDRHGRET